MPCRALVERSEGALHSEPPKRQPCALRDYWTYLQAYRPIAERLGVSYGELDQALWNWNKAGMPRAVGRS